MYILPFSTCACVFVSSFIHLLTTMDANTKMLKNKLNLPHVYRILLYGF